MSVSDFEGYKKWSQLPKDQQQIILNNVFCRNCFTTTIVDYTIHNDENGVLLNGKCEKCGKDVARVVEDL